MNTVSAEWEQRSAALWDAIDSHEPDAFVRHVEQLAAELPGSSPVGAFERACAQDSTGHPERAVPLYRAALAGGLTGLRRRRATIQLASSLRHLGQAAEAAELLMAESGAESDTLDTAVQAFLALALADLGREREALGLSLAALASYLPRYRRSLARYAAELRPTVAPAVAESAAESREPPSEPVAAGGGEGPTSAARPALTLVPLDVASFPVFLEQAIEAYAEGNVAAGRWPAADALSLARRETGQLLPDGVDTPGHSIFGLAVPGSASPVGHLWLASMPRGTTRVTYVYQIMVHPEHRRLGYAREALLQAEVLARRQGHDAMALNVFAPNTHAHTLYRSLGYAVTNMNMVKPLTRA